MGDDALGKGQQLGREIGRGGGIRSSTELSKRVSPFVARYACVRGDPHEAHSAAETGKVIEGRNGVPNSGVSCSQGREGRMRVAEDLDIPRLQGSDLVKDIMSSQENGN